jgi:hypothetical protein
MCLQYYQRAHLIILDLNSVGTGTVLYTKV